MNLAGKIIVTVIGYVALTLVALIVIGGLVWVAQQVWGAIL